MRRIESTFTFAVASSALLAFLGCPGVNLPPSPPDADAVVHLFGDTGKVGQAPGVPSSSAKPLHLYIDASGSMKGFVAHYASTYQSILESLLDRAATSGYDLRVFGFGAEVSQSLGSLGPSTIMSPSFYSSGQSSFPALFSRIAEEHESGAISVVISDLVQSGRTGDQRDLVLGFQKLAGKRPEALVFAFRSAFEGRYFVEGARRGTVLNLALDGSSAERSRPFYVLVVAPSRKDLDRARRTLFPDTGAYEEFDASRPGVILDSLEYLPPGTGSLPIWNTYTVPKVLSGGSLTPCSLLSFLEIAAPPDRKSPLRLGFIVRDANPSLGTIRWASNLSFAVERRLLRAGQWKAVEEMDLTPEALFSRDGKSITLSYSFPRPDPFSWDAYRIRLMPGEGNLRLPLWVEDWTALDDSLPLWGNRTLKLNLFVEAMVRSIQEQVPLSEHYILLGRGK